MRDTKLDVDNHFIIFTLIIISISQESKPARFLSFFWDLQIIPSSHISQLYYLRQAFMVRMHISSRSKTQLLRLHHQLEAELVVPSLCPLMGGPMNES